MKERKRYSVWAMILGVVIFAAAAVFVVLLFTGTQQEPEAVFTGTQLQITGQYGETYDLKDISGVSLEQRIPEIGRKVDGAGLGSIKKGDYEVSGLGTCRLFLMSDQGPYLLFRQGPKYTIVRFEDPEKTRSLYNTLIEKTG